VRRDARLEIEVIMVSSSRPTALGSRCGCCECPPGSRADDRTVPSQPFRILQGVGGAMMVPVGRLGVLGKTPKPQLMRMLGFHRVAWPHRPVAGGATTTEASWHWLVLINVPLGAIAFAAACG